MVFELNGARALSDFRAARVLAALQRVSSNIEAVSGRFVHFVHASRELTKAEEERLASLLTYGDAAEDVRADFTRPLLRPESLDLLVSNPPYVGKTEYEGLSAEVRDFEPVTALVPNFVDSDKIPSHDHHHDHGGSHSHAPSTPPDKPEGLEHLIAVAQEAFVALKPGGLLLMEHGYAQGAAIKVLLESHKWENVLILKDLSGHDRVASARKPAA